MSQVIIQITLLITALLAPKEPEKQTIALTQAFCEKDKKESIKTDFSAEQTTSLFQKIKNLKIENERETT